MPPPGHVMLHATSLRAWQRPRPRWYLLRCGRAPQEEACAGQALQPGISTYIAISRSVTPPGVHACVAGWGAWCGSGPGTRARPWIGRPCLDECHALALQDGATASAAHGPDMLTSSRHTAGIAFGAPAFGGRPRALLALAAAGLLHMMPKGACRTANRICLFFF